VKVHEISHKGKTTLVEWDDGRMHKVYIPSDTILDGEVSSDTLSAGIPFGADFSNLPCVTPEQLEEMLHRMGIWTAEDVRRKPNDVLLVLQAAYRITLAAFQEAVLGE
jgi:hypothetical protein